MRSGQVRHDAPPDQPTRARVLRDFDTTLLLEAGAGTGKTTVLVSRILALALVRSGRAPLDRIVAITFTEKAAGELKLRLGEEIEAAIDAAKSDEERERLEAASFDLQRARVSTIHAFAAGLLRERPSRPASTPASRWPPRSPASASSPPATRKLQRPVRSGAEVGTGRYQAGRLIRSRSPSRVAAPRMAASIAAAWRSTSASCVQATIPACPGSRE